MGEIRAYTHPEGAQNMRADKAAAAFLAGEVSRSRLEESFRAGLVKIAGEPILKKREIRAGETMEIELPAPLDTEVRPADIPVEILYEDEDIAIVNKPAGMTVHPGSGTGDDTLVHAMLHHTKGKLSTAGGRKPPALWLWQKPTQPTTA